MRGYNFPFGTVRPATISRQSHKRLKMRKNA